MNLYYKLVRYLPILVSITLVPNVFADNDHKPLPRPDLLPLSTEHLQQIQGMSQKVITARQSQTPDPRSEALRVALLDIHAEIGSVLAVTVSPEKLSSVPCEPEHCAQGGKTQSRQINMTRIQARRHQLHTAITDAENEPRFAHMTNRARELESEVDAANQAPQEERLTKLSALYKTLEPRANLGPEQQTLNTVLATRHTLVHHQPGVHHDSK